MIAAFQREVDCRVGLESTTVISILAHHGGDTAKIPAKAFGPFPDIRLSTEPAGQGTSLNLLLVMERGSSDLSDIISHSDLAGKNMLRVRSIALGAAKCLQYMHGEGKLHGDFKVHRLSVRPSLGPTAVVRRRQRHESSLCTLSLPKLTCPTRGLPPLLRLPSRLGIW